MKVLKNKNLFNKLIIVILFVLLLAFVTPNIVKADDDDTGIGGILLNPVMSLFVGIGDGAISLLQNIIIDADVSFIEIETSDGSILAIILGVIVCVAIVVAGIASIVASGGTALAIVSGVIKVTISGVVKGLIVFSVTAVAANAVLPEDFVLPQIKLSPYEIFSNQVLLLDVNFFNPRTAKIEEKIVTPAEKETSVDLVWEGLWKEGKYCADFNFAGQLFSVDVTEKYSNGGEYDRINNSSCRLRNI